MSNPYFIVAKNGPEKARKLAVVEGGKLDKQFIWLCDGDTEDDLSPSELTSLVKIVRGKLEKKGHYSAEQLNARTNEIVDKFQPQQKLRSLEIKDGKIQPIPPTDTRECIYVCGSSGSGKSTYVRGYAKAYNKLFPKNKVILFSKISNDTSLKGIKNLIQIDLNDELVIDPIEISELSDALVIFDDCNTILDKTILKSVQGLMAEILEEGRHYNIWCAITSHLISNYRESRVVLNESHALTVYPQSGSAHQIKQSLSKYYGLDLKDIAKLFKLNSRAVTVKKTYPQVVIAEHDCYLIGGCFEDN